jgi:DNA helicase II / ATP-dependent DNA helicase PcrA
MTFTLPCHWLVLNGDMSTPHTIAVMANLLDNLNEPQLAAVTLPAQHALILAGAGSGKTKVLTTRIAWLISTQQISPQGLLAVTFTNKAAREMLTRITTMLPINPRGMWVGTFHGLCNRLLRAHYRDAALPQTFQILDSQDQLAAIKRLLKSLNVDDEKYPPKNLMYFINGSKEEGLRPHQVEVYDDYNKRFIELYAAYEQQCQREGVVDFSELLLRSFELLERNQPLREHYQARFRHILVDEFQDTNNLQYKWLKLLAGHGQEKPSAVFAVGDDDQSIYAFRGANVGNMSAFEREFKVQNMIKLEQNYRSHANILNCANALIEHNDQRLGKNLWTDAGEGEPVRVYEAVTDLQESQWLLEEIKGLIYEGHMRSDIALLYRSNAQSRVIEHGLFSAGIPYKVYGGLRFFERAEVKHALAYMRLMENPNDDGALLRVVNFPARGIGARSIEQLQDAAKSRGSSLYDAAAHTAGSGAAKLIGFVKLVEQMRFETQHLPLPEMVEHIIDRSGLLKFYESEREGQDRIENLRELINAASAFLSDQSISQDVAANMGVSNVAGGALGERVVVADLPEAPGAVQMTPLAGFLSHASLEAGDNQAAVGVDAVQLMTVHAAKGLEFDAVFITGLEEGLFPHENSSTEVAGLEEERRLMYVAITRARKRLYISFSQTRMLHGQTRYNLKSRFLDELPEAALKWLTPRTQQSVGYGGSGAGFGGGDHAYGSAWQESSVKRIERSSDRGIAFRVGQSVAHAKFGEGVIINIEGAGQDARVQVNFGREGVKWLALSVAKLQAA